MKNIYLKNFKLLLVREFDNYKDYDIYYNDIKIGVFLIVEHEDYIFGRQVHIFDEFQRNGYAKLLFEELSNFYTIRFTIATNSNKAVCFWKKYLETHNHKHIKGETYEISKITL